SSVMGLLAEVKCGHRSQLNNYSFIVSFEQNSLHSACRWQQPEPTTTLFALDGSPPGFALMPSDAHHG
ncbi:MAG: hypothetical protein ACXWWI_07000, partial [Nitrospira sp.]